MQRDRNEQRASHDGMETMTRARENEVLRNGAGPLRSGLVPPAAGDKTEERLPLFWRIFGSTVLSIAALVALTLYQQVNNALNELRSEQGHLNQNLGDTVKKDEFNNRILTVAHRIEEVQASNSGAADIWRERATLLERQIKVSEEERKQMAKEHARELQQLGERLAVMEGRLAPSSSLTRSR